MLDLGFSETSKNCSSFYNFFHSFQGVAKGKNLKNQCIVLAIFQQFFSIFSLVSVFKKYDTTDKKIPQHYAMEGFGLLYIHVVGQDRNLSEPT